MISLLKTPFPKMGWFNNNGDVIDINGTFDNGRY